MLADTWKGRKSFSPFFISDTYEMLHIVSFLKDCIHHWKNNIKDKIDKFICKKRVWRIYSDHCTLTKDALSLKPCNYKTSETLIRSNFRVFAQHYAQFFPRFFLECLLSSLFHLKWEIMTLKPYSQARNIFSVATFNKMNFIEWKKTKSGSNLDLCFRLYQILVYQICSWQTSLQ